MWKRVYSLIRRSTKCFGFIQFSFSVLDWFITVIKVSLKSKSNFLITVCVSLFCFNSFANATYFKVLFLSIGKLVR